ncbi:MAG: SDR family NAD(P)-dependent oxidoreductase [Acidimicrobiales bacterium]
MSTSVLITGAGTGFGRGAAVELARRGHPVIATTVSQAEAVELAAAQPELKTAKLDITDPDDRRQVADWRVDVLVNNAGLGQVGPLRSIPLDRVRRIFETNVFGTLAMTQAVVPQMFERGSGRILILSSVAGVAAGPMTGPYSMTKHALQAMGSAMRAELAPAGIDVALVNPGPFATGFNDRMIDDPGEWFDRDTARPEELRLLEGARQRITANQLDPAEVVLVIADLVEAGETQLVNFVPPDMLARMGLDKRH